MSALFSERQGHKKPRVELQIDSMDVELRTKIWNCLYMHGLGRLSVDDHQKPYRSKNRAFLVALYHSYFKWPVDEIPHYHPAAFERIKRYFFECTWFQVYDFVDFALSNYPDQEMLSAIDVLNISLTEEHSGYRIVNKEVLPVTSKEESEAIEDAASSKIGPVKQQIEKAISLFSDRAATDYANSIKSSISAVESLCRMIAADNSKTLSDSLRGVEKRLDLQKALSKSLDCLYGYRNVEPGVGHGGTDHEAVSFDDAKFFLVTCSAWVNYLTAKSAEAGIILGDQQGSA